MDQHRKNVRSTRPKEKTTPQKGEETDKPEVEPHITERMNLMYVSIHEIECHT
jgi:hypothetical protein